MKLAELISTSFYVNGISTVFSASIGTHLQFEAVGGDGERVL